MGEGKVAEAESTMGEEAKEEAEAEGEGGLEEEEEDQEETVEESDLQLRHFDIQNQMEEIEVKAGTLNLVWLTAAVV